MALKVMTIVGTRPEIIKLSRVIAELDQHVEHVLVHTGQNFDYELNEILFRDLAIRRPDQFLNAAGESAAQTIGNVVAKADQALAAHRPDAVLLYGDTNSCLAVIAAKRRRIPVFHMEAGNRCFDQRVPEEINRKLVDHLADINMPLSEHARHYLLAEGLRPETVIKTGSSMPEVLQYYRPGIERSDVLARMALAEHDYFVVSAHREENVDDEASFRALLATLNAIAARYGKRLIVSTHPRTRKRLEGIGTVELSSLIELVRPLGFFDYVKLQMHSRCVLSDSGTLTEEASLLAIPAVMLRQAHERPEGMDEASVIMSGLDAPRVLQAIEINLAHHDAKQRPFHVPADYDVDNVSKKVLRIILSYTDYVNRTVWHRS
ncbi:MAG: UDP-N-acetylglucosamine 2-epimerase (non-hydrolyzing) [Burkholderiales bacterium]|nr:UDP-N-acetylglucosamine 2-epimerase (non-hydrolyzing) [Burkholderiales bacterium]